jgi:peptidoglycan-N-acetylglucosamine deacetylase
MAIVSPGWWGLMGLRNTILLWTLPLALGVGAANAEDCPGNPDALGVSRTIVVDPRQHSKIGTMDYVETLPLADREVVLTFDDGPLPPYTNRILDILAAECVKATYFIVGSMAKAYPDTLRRIQEAGHTIGTHSMTHPLHFRAQSVERARAQIDDGIGAVAAVLGDPDKVAPFFRFPGFGYTADAHDYAAARGLMVWGADVPADDWHFVGAKEVASRAIRRLESKGKGILLLHDIHPRTVGALPIILGELKERGFRIVHVVPSSPDRPATVTTAAAWRLKGEPKPAMPVIRLAALQDFATDGLLGKTAEELCSITSSRHDPGRNVLRKRRPSQVAQHVDNAKSFRPDIHAVQ